MNLINERSQRSLLLPGDVGRSPDSEAVGYLSGMYPINIITVIEETGDTKHRLWIKTPIYTISIETLLNGTRELGLGGLWCALTHGLQRLDPRQRIITRSF